MVEPAWAATAPVLVLVATALALFLVDSIDPESNRPRLLSGVAFVGALAAMGVSLVYLLTGVGVEPISLYGGQLVVDQMALFFQVIVTSVTAVVVLGSHDYLDSHAYQAEYYTLIMLAVTGMAVMAAAGSLAVAFIALELASLPSYALVAFMKQNKGSVEAGLKYFLIGALSSAVFAFGISLVYAATGTLMLDGIAEELTQGTELPGVLGVGLLMIIGGFAYKTASVPFHFWAPEAYEGAPAPVSAFISSASKAAGFALAFRVLVVAFPIASSGVQNALDWTVVVTILAVATMTLGNFAAATQENVKRMLAYSSIGHAGYVLIALAALTGTGDQSLILGAGMIHLLVYGFMNTGAFLFVALAEHWDVGRTFQDYRGLAEQAPFVSVAMTVFMFSLAGLPVGAGFLSKYYLFAGAVSGGLWWLALVGAVNSALSLFYYSRVVKALWIDEPDEPHVIESYPSALYGAVIVAAVVTVGLLPGLVLFDNVAFDAAAVLFG
ncbi:NADH-quinone oxidoreductase subunit N [Halosegnis longus]|uniref:NADH-quinone oxidoreductase subunit N n=1 Tax=Halosegnis longus TaxID=2216012 RepID=A0AAJ4R9X2_9EURY|nr:MULTISPECIES: NADH-quinone oxidoreductase subunit N [Halobacteriales]RNJ26876.1 NADH-quinone oxidoreductase subunit N [Salella cibi]